VRAGRRRVVDDVGFNRGVERQLHVDVKRVRRQIENVLQADQYATTRTRLASTGRASARVHAATSEFRRYLLLFISVTSNNI